MRTPDVRLDINILTVFFSEIGAVIPDGSVEARVSVDIRFVFVISRCLIDDRLQMFGIGIAQNRN